MVEPIVIVQPPGLGGWKDLDWLEEIHEPAENGNVDHGWDALFNTADPEDDNTGCPLNQ